MKRRLLLVQLCWVILLGGVYAAETEPNSTVAQANTLTLNGNNTGRIAIAADNDYFRVTTTSDGRLNLTLTTSSGKSIGVYLYDNNGTTLLNSATASATFTQSKDGLAAGTYYVLVKCTSATDTATYTISNTLNTAPQANDAEPNDSRATALTFALNTTRTGHIGYYYTNKRDTSDWYRITTTSSRKLKLNCTPANGHSVTLSLYASNGLSLIGNASGTTAFSLTTDGLKLDNYYVKINASTTSDFAPYTLADSVFTPTTDSFLLALNYRYSTRITTPGGAHWWRINVNADGNLKLALTPLTPKFVYFYLYDRDRTTLLKSSYSNAAFSETTNGLAPGTYYVKVVPYYSTDSLSYALADTLTTPTQAVEAEPNNSRAQALALTLNSTKTGHVGYYYDKKRDTADWYRVTTNADGRLNLSLTPANGSYIYMYLYDNNGTTLLNSNYSNAAFSFSTDGLAAGTYYIKVNCYYTSDFAPYTLVNSLTLPAQANDTEPNDSRATALALALNGSTVGHVGYYYNNRRDTTDWYRVTTNADGRLNLSLTPANGSFIYMYLYDNNGTTLLNSNYSNAAFNFSTDGLAVGTYYIKVNCYYTSGFTPYTLVNSLTLPAQANDIEPNDSRATALALAPNGSTVGHVGYYYNNKRDTADWYRVTTTGDGLLRLSLNPVNGSNAYIYLYDNNGTTLLNSGYSNVAFNFNTDGLAAGTYYVKVNCYYNNQFAPYILSNTLVVPAQTNNPEPNDSRAQAIGISINVTRTGHVGYYYNNRRDTTDWFRITTSSDGMMKIKLAPANGSFIYATLLDNDGTTVLNSTYSNAAFVQNTDGLAAGTYYLKVYCYYNNQFAPYTFTDSLITYSFANDAEPNRRPFQGAGVAANSTVTGHVNFYYNRVKDSVDWWKLNYTGSGNLQFTFNLASKKSDGTIPFTYFYVYKDTLGSPVYSNYFNTASNVINLASLTKTTYYIRVNPYYTSDFVTYSFANSFTPTLLRKMPEQVTSAVTTDIGVYPNPVSDRIHIRNGNTGTITSVILRTAGGEAVWRQLNTAVKSGGTVDINVSKFPAGNYVIQMTDENGKITSKKIVILR